jgi:hypothetical protein
LDLDKYYSMPRANRYWVVGAAYHLTHRCYDRSFLFRFVRDHDALLGWIDGITWPQFQSHYCQFVGDTLTSVESLRRDWRWTEVIAVGSFAFVSRVEADLVLNGRRARLDLDKADDGAWILREESPDGIRAGNGTENRAISAKTGGL